MAETFQLFNQLLVLFWQLLSLAPRLTEQICNLYQRAKEDQNTIEDCAQPLLPAMHDQCSNSIATMHYGIESFLQLLLCLLGCQ